MSHRLLVACGLGFAASLVSFSPGVCSPFARSFGTVAGALPGVTSLSGRVVSVDGIPLGGVVLSDGRIASTRTDADGRFLLQFVPAGKSVLRIDGRHGGAAGDIDYGTYEVQVKAAAGRVTALPFTSWLTPIDHANDIVIASPTTKETVVTSPRLPGFQMIIPAGTILTDWDGKRINRISLTPVRADRPPFPLPREVMFNDYFTAQPGGTTLWTVNGQRGAARVIYPNHGNGVAGSRSTFWHYHPETVGWLPYGTATVSGDGKTVVPDEGATVYDFMGGGDPARNNNTPPSQQTDPSNDSTAGEPVDLGSGLFTSTMTDLAVADVMPVTVTRSYMSSDANYRSFGLGMSLSDEMYPQLTGGSTGTPAAEEFSQLVIETPTSGITFTNTTPAYGDYSDALFVEQSQPGPFLGAQAFWTGNGFEVKQRNGMTYAFGYHNPLTYIQDRFGNRVSLTYEQVNATANGAVNQIVKVTSPNGRFVQFTWEDLFPNGTGSPTGSDIYVIQKAVDNLGRETDYTYDACGRLTAVADAHAVANNLGARTTFTWATPASGSTCPVLTGTNAPLNLLAAVNDQNTALIVRNDQYEWMYTLNGQTYTGPNVCEKLVSGSKSTTPVTGRVCHQQLAPPSGSSFSTYSFAYNNVDANENIGQTVITDPRSNTRVVNFQLYGQQSGTTVQPMNAPGYAINETYASNDSTNSQTWTYQRDPVTNTLLQVTAPPLTEEGESAGRVTAFCYDNTTYPGSPAAPVNPFRPWNLTSVVRNLTASGNACPGTIPTGSTSTTANATTLFTYSPTYNLVTGITDPNGNTTTFCRTSGQAGCPSQTYTLEEAASLIDANGNSTSLAYQPNGQLQSTSRVATSSQTLQSTLAYDHNDLASVTGVGATTAPQVASRTSLIYTDAVGRAIQRTDPLGDVSTATFDPIFGPLQVTDANGTYETFTYAANGNTSRIGQPKGTTQLTYNLANLVSTFTDPLNFGQSNPVQAYFYYDTSRNLTCTIDRKGNQASFTYDSLNRRSGATYYIGNTSGCSGTPGTVDSTATYSYDHGNRLLTITDSTGGTTTRKFDDLDRISSDAQAQASGTSIGTVNYSYDIGSRLAAVGSTNASTDSYIYDPANRLIAISRSNGAYVCNTYDQANRRTALVYPGSQTANTSWDVLSDALQIAYTYNGSYTPGSGGAPGTCTPGTTATGNGVGTLTYAYDQDGRQIGRGGTYFTLVPPSPFAAGTASYNADNQQTLWNGLANIFDANGNLTCLGSSSSTSCTGTQSQALAWDARRRLVSAAGNPVTGGSAETYVYDGLSRRQSVTNATAATQATYLYRGLDPVQVNTINTATGSSTDLTKIFLGLGLDERFYLYGGSASDSGAVITDIEGSTVKLQTNLATNVSYAYPPFGSTGAASASSLNTFRYTGREASDNTGLYYYRGRYYAPGQSRFISEDPLGLAAGANVYAYVNNDPLNLLDPLGLCSTGGPQNITQLLGLILATEVAGLGPEDPVADAAVLAEIAAYEGEGYAIGTVLADGTVVGADAAGAAPNLAQLGAKFGINASSETGANILSNLNTPVQQFISENRLASINSVFPGEYLNMTVGQALRQGGSTVRKLLLDSRFAK